MVQIDGFEGEFEDNSLKGILLFSNDRQASLARALFSLSKVLVGVRSCHGHIKNGAK